MKCLVCKHGDTSSGSVSITLERGIATLVFKNVPGTYVLIEINSFSTAKSNLMPVRGPAAAYFRYENHPWFSPFGPAYRLFKFAPGEFVRRQRQICLEQIWALLAHGVRVPGRHESAGDPDALLTVAIFTFPNLIGNQILNIFFANSF